MISCFCLIKTIKFWTGVCVAIDGLDSRYNGYVIVFKQILVILLTYIYPPPPHTYGDFYKKQSYNDILYQFLDLL